MREFVRNCRLCKEPMETSPFALCPTCLMESEQIRLYIAKNPHVSICEIARSTKVPYQKVESMVHLGLNRKGSITPEAL